MNEVTTIEAKAPMTIFDKLAARGMVVVKQVTRTVLQQQDDVPFAVQFEAVPVVSQVAEVGRGGKPKMEPARVCDVLNLENGAHQLLIMNTVLEGELDRNYPDAGYVGKQFLIKGYRPMDGHDENGAPKFRRYKVYEIIEIEMEVAAPSSINRETAEVVADGTNPVNRKGKPV